MRKAANMLVHQFRRPGWTITELCLVVALGAIMFCLASPWLQQARVDAKEDRCMDNLKKLALACHNYHDVWQSLPFMRGGTFGPGGEDNLSHNDLSMSGFVSLSPFLGESDIYDQAATNNFGPVPWKHCEYWDSQILVLQCPADEHDKMGFGDNNYKFVVGTTVLDNSSCAGERTNGMFDNVGVDRDDPSTRLGRTIRMRDVTDGLSNTLMLSERRTGFGFDKNDIAWVAANIDLALDAIPDNTIVAAQQSYEACWSHAIDGGGRSYNEGTTVIDAYPGSRWHDGRPFYSGVTTIVPPNGPSCASGDKDDSQGVFTASSRHELLVMVALGDGSVSRIRDTIDLPTWWALGTRAGREAIPDGFRD